MKTYKRPNTNKRFANGRPKVWDKTQEDRIRPQGMTRAEWRALGSTRRHAIIAGIWAAVNNMPESVVVVEEKPNGSA